jgi:hypothetical protein
VSAADPPMSAMFFTWFTVTPCSSVSTRPASRARFTSCMVLAPLGQSLASFTALRRSPSMATISPALRKTS